MSSCEPHNNQRAENTLAACLRGGRLSHATLVEGDGGLDFALKIARAALCSSEEDKPCGVCRDCVKTEKGIHPDLTVYSGGDKSRSFHIDTVRNIRRDAYIKPNEAGCKVFILENAQNMTAQAQNALLKIIEEPPADTAFILTCDNKAAMLETVLSRVSVFSLDETPRQDSGTGVNEDGDSGIGAKAEHILSKLLSDDELEVLAAFAPFERDRSGFASLLAALRDAASIEIGKQVKASDSRTRHSGYLRLIKIIDIIDEMERALVQNVNGLLLTAMLPAIFNLDRRRPK